MYHYEKSYLPANLTTRQLAILYVYSFLFPLLYLQLPSSLVHSPLVVMSMCTLMIAYGLLLILRGQSIVKSRLDVFLGILLTMTIYTMAFPMSMKSIYFELVMITLIPTLSIVKFILAKRLHQVTTRTYIKYETPIILNYITTLIIVTLHYIR